jgi:hypothetical protein
VIATPDDTALLSRCSFCGKPNTEVERLVAGPGVYICNECVSLCADILARHAGRGPAQRTHPWGAMSDEELLGHIPRIAATATAVESDLRQWVEELRRRGVTWARIGSALGITRQSAWERFSGEE